MKRKITFLGLFILLICSSFNSLNTWDYIKEKTWISISGGWINGEQIVFYESKNGIKKAIKQLYGSGVYVVATVIYDVDFSHDTLYLSNCIEDKTAVLKLIFTPNDSVFVSSNGTLKYKKLTNEPIVYNWQGNYHAGEKLPIETLKNVPIKRGVDYDKNTFSNKGLMINP